MRLWCTRTTPERVGVRRQAYYPRGWDGPGLALHNRKVPGAATFRVCRSISVGVLELLPGADVTLRAGKEIIFYNGLRAGAGSSLRVLLEEI